MKREIKFESHEVTVMRIGRRQALSQYCTVCGEAGLHITVARASALSRLPESAIFRMAQGGELHSTESADGVLMICGRSVEAFVTKGAQP